MQELKVKKERREKSFLLVAVMVFILMLLLILGAAFIVDHTTEAYFMVGNALNVREEETGEEWDQLEQLNVFEDICANGESIIAPSSSGSYSFSIYNRAGFQVSYYLTVTDENLAKVPMEFRLKNGSGEYVLGADAEWVTIKELQGIHGFLEYDTETGYTLDWRWPGEDNLADTMSGVLAQNGKSIYVLNFLITAEQSGPIVNSAVSMIRRINNIAFFISLLIVLLAIAIFVLIWWLVKRYERKKAENERII